MFDLSLCKHRDEYRVTEVTCGETCLYRIFTGGALAGRHISLAVNSGENKLSGFSAFLHAVIALAECIPVLGSAIAFAESSIMFKGSYVLKERVFSSPPSGEVVVNKEILPLPSPPSQPLEVKWPNQYISIPCSDIEDISSRAKADPFLMKATGEPCDFLGIGAFVVWEWTGNDPDGYNAAMKSRAEALWAQSKP